MADDAEVAGAAHMGEVAAAHVAAAMAWTASSMARGVAAQAAVAGSAVVQQAGCVEDDDAKVWVGPESRVTCFMIWGRAQMDVSRT